VAIHIPVRYTVQLTISAAASRPIEASVMGSPSPKTSMTTEAKICAISQVATKVTTAVGTSIGVGEAEGRIALRIECGARSCEGPATGGEAIGARFVGGRVSAPRYTARTAP
jgi:hypothetical protein